MTFHEWINLKSKYPSDQLAWPTILVLAFDILFLTFSFYLFGSSVFATIVSWIVLVIVMLHLYLILHEATHKAISKKNWINIIIGHLSGWIILMPYLARRRSHLLHHYWTGHPFRDPANDRAIKRFAVMTDQDAEKLEFIWKNWIPLLTLNDRLGLWFDPFIQKRNGLHTSAMKKEINFVYSYIGLYIFVFTLTIWQGWLPIFLAWYVPALLLLLLAEELVNLPHHAETPLLSKNASALPYHQQYQVTHSCKSLPIWSRYILLNFNFHTSHHTLPWAPWYQLPLIHEDLKKSLLHEDLEGKIRNELEWSLINRKKPLLEIMGHYFNPNQIR